MTNRKPSTQYRVTRIQHPVSSTPISHQLSAINLAPYALRPEPIIYHPDHTENEERWITMGISRNSRLLIVCHRFHEESREVVTIRIFSSRKANKREIREYGEQL